MNRIEGINDIIEMDIIEEINGVNELIRQTGHRINLIRKNHNHTQKDLSRLVAVSTSYMSRLLCDKDEWRKDRVRIIADYYKVPFEYLYYGVTVSERMERYDNDMDFETQCNDFLLRLKSMPDRDQFRYGLFYIIRLANMISELNFIDEYISTPYKY